MLNNLQFSKIIHKTYFYSEATIDGSENGLVWPEFTKSNQLMMYLNSSQPSIKQNPLKDNYKFWNSLPIYPQKSL